MKTTLTIAAIAFTTLATFGAHAADNKQMQIESWSFGASNPSLASASGGSGCASGEVKAPRDMASGQASGKSVAGYDLKTAKGARMAASPPSCDQSSTAPSPQAVRESPTKSSFGKSKELTGHVTLVK